MIIHSLISDVNLRSTYDVDYQRRLGQDAIRANQMRRKDQCALALNDVIGDSDGPASDDERGSLGSWTIDQESGREASDTDSSLVEEVFVSYELALCSHSRICIHLFILGAVGSQQRIRGRL